MSLKSGLISPTRKFQNGKNSKLEGRRILSGENRNLLSKNDWRPRAPFPLTASCLLDIVEIVQSDNRLSFSWQEREDFLNRGIKQIIS